MSLIFYYAPMSTASVVQLVLEELGVPHEKVRMDFKDGSLQKPEFLKVNPNGKVPAIVHDGVPIFESVAINIHLGETFGVEKKLFPAPGPKRGEALKWLVWSNVSLGEAVGRWMRNTMEHAPAEQRNAAAGEAAKADAHKLLAILDQALAGRSYLLGDFSIPDIHLHGMVGWMGMMGFDLAPYPNIKAWAARCAARPAYAKVMSAT